MKILKKFSLVLALCFAATVPVASTTNIGESLETNCVATAATTKVNYVYNGNYIYNWGTREETATFLSPNAETFYQTNQKTYDTLATYAGGTGTSNASTSALFKALQNLMTNAHSHKTSYNATKDLFRYTDCQNSGGKISSFYSGQGIGPSWDGSWNREHTWPNSKGLNGSDEDDIMMLRPTSTSENSSRGNTAYGKSSGYYNPNSESNGKHDLRGDVSRIFLYVYVRWGNVNGNGSYSTWGTRGVMENLTVLLEWMEADPVDTWELGRNDSVQTITGTRNVFVDYPEYAWLLFGQEMPDDMTTPSGKAMSAKPSQGGTTNPDQGGTTNPDQGGTTNPDQGGTTNPDQGGTTNPDQGGTTNPDQGGTTNPDQGGTTNPDQDPDQEEFPDNDNSEETCEHEFESWFIQIDPTETEEGARSATCKKCGKYVVETIPALNDADDAQMISCSSSVALPTLAVFLTTISCCFVLKKKD